MASVNFQKVKSGSELRAKVGHAGRWDGRPVRYENDHIDRTLTPQNYTLTRREVAPRDETGSEVCKRLKERVALIDTVLPPKRRRADRVTQISMTIPAPEGLDPRYEKSFFEIAYAEIARAFGGYKNLSPMYVHRDEVHEYIDPATHKARTSRVHAHVIGVPFVPGRGVNAKNFLTRDRMREINERIHFRAKKELDIAFMSGTRERSRADMEALKIASIHAAEERAAEAAQEAVKEARRLRGIQKDIRAEQARLRALEEASRDLHDEYEEVSLERRAHFLAEDEPGIDEHVTNEEWDFIQGFESRVREHYEGEER